MRGHAAPEATIDALPVPQGIPLDTTTWAKEPKPMVAAKDVDTNVSAGSFTVPGTSLPVVTTFS